MAAENQGSQTFDRLTVALKHCTPEELQRLTQKKGFSGVESVALQFAHAALTIENEAAAQDLFDTWLELDLIEKATTPREKVFIEFADVCIDCAF